jgi:uncharacterized OsmC-like protein
VSDETIEQLVGRHVSLRHEEMILHRALRDPASGGGPACPGPGPDRARFLDRRADNVVDSGFSMDRDELRALQAPIKERYRADPDAAVVVLKAEGRIGEGVTCRVETGRALVAAGLHPATGGTGLQVCSGDMLLQALVACAGVTMSAVATSLGIPLRGGTLEAEGELDFRGTLGVSKDAPVGFRRIRLAVVLDCDATAEERRKLLELTERYCVVYQTLRRSPDLEIVERGES